MLTFFKKLVKNNNGYSSKTFVMLWGILIITIWSFFLMFIIYLSVVKKFEIQWVGISTLIGALATLALAVIYGKVKGEQYENYYNNKNEEEP